MPPSEMSHVAQHAFQALSRGDVSIYTYHSGVDHATDPVVNESVRDELLASGLMSKPRGNGPWILTEAGIDYSSRHHPPYLLEDTCMCSSAFACRDTFLANRRQMDADPM